MRRSEAGGVLFTGLTIPLLAWGFAFLSGAGLSGEFLLDTTRVRVRSTAVEREPAAAFDGENWLVAWTAADGDIRATRLSVAGTVLDSSGITVAAASGSQSAPDLIWNGDDYFVVWQDRRNVTHDDIYGARVSRSGSVLDPDGIRIASAGLDQSAPRVAFDGSNCLVAWNDERSGDSLYDIYAARVSRVGSVLDPDGIAVSRGVAEERLAELAFDGGNYLAVWRDSRTGHFNAYAARITPAGAVLDPDGIAVSRDPADRVNGLSAAFGGGSCFVTWAANADNHIYGARLAPDGTLLDSNWIVVSRRFQVIEDQPAVGFDGANFLVAWATSPYENADIYAARITPQGTVLDSPARFVSNALGQQTHPAVSAGGGKYLVTWTDERLTDADARCARLDSTGSLLDPNGIPLAWRVNGQGVPAIVSGGVNYLVVWQDERREGDILGALLNQSGAVLPPGPFAVCCRDGEQKDPAVSFDGTNYFVVWQDGRYANHDIRGTRVTTSGQVLDTSGIRLSSGSGDEVTPDITFDGRSYWVIWTSSSGGQLMGVRVAPSGTVRDSQPRPVGGNRPSQFRGRVQVGMDSVTLATWFEGSGADYNILATRLTPSGGILDSTSFSISRAPDWQREPEIACDGYQWLVCWTDRRDRIRQDVYAARVRVSGQVLDPAGIPVSIAAQNRVRFEPAAMFDGNDFLIAWTDDRDSASLDFDLYGARLSTSGTRLDTFRMVVGPGSQRSAFLEPGPNQGLLVFSGWAGVVEGREYNAQRVWVKSGPFPGVAEDLAARLVRVPEAATVVHGAYHLQGKRPALMLDVNGRVAGRLVPGDNDMRGLRAGVYFLVPEGERAGPRKLVRN